METIRNSTRLGSAWGMFLTSLILVASARADEDHDHAEARFLSAKSVEPMGIIALSLSAVAVALGAFRRRWRPTSMLKIHGTRGHSTLVAGAVDAALVVFLR